MRADVSFRYSFVLLLMCNWTAGHAQELDVQQIQLQQESILLKGGEKALKVETGQVFVYKIEFSPDGDEVALLFRFAQPAIFATDSWRMLRLLPAMRHLDFSSDGKQFVTAEGNAGIRLWSRREPGVSTKYLGNEHALVRSAVFSPDGGLIASAHDDGEIKFWNAKDRTLIKSISKHNQAVHRVRFSPLGNALYSSGDGRAIEIWDMDSLKHRKTLKGPPAPAVMDLAVSLDEKMLISTHQKIGAMLWNLETGIAQVKSGYFAIDCSPTEAVAAIARDKLLFIDTDSGKQIASVELSTKSAPFLASTLKFTPDGKRIAIGANSGKVYVLHVPNAENRN